MDDRLYFSEQHEAVRDMVRTFAREQVAPVAARHDADSTFPWETVKVIIQALLIAFVVRTFLFQPFNIPSASMYPTLKIGDYIFVSKLSYGYGKYSFNFSLGLGGRDSQGLQQHEGGGGNEGSAGHGASLWSGMERER